MLVVVVVVMIIVVVVVLVAAAVAVILCVGAIVLVVVIVIVVVVILAVVVTANISQIPNLSLLLFLVLLMDMLCTCPGFKSSACCTRRTDGRTDRRTAIFACLMFRR